MAYTDDAVLAKLSALNETHDSIATAAQWIMFHRRHAERTVQLWFQRLKDSPSPKRLNLIYLANEVTQQSKARHKDDFVLAFSPVIAEAITSAYKGAPSEVQNKLRRVVDVWRDRSIFEAPILGAVDSRIGELDKAKGAARPGLGGSIFGSSSGGTLVPEELVPLVAPQQNLSKLLISTQGSVTKVDSDYQRIVESPAAAAPVHAARLNGLLKTIASAENAMRQMIQARTDLKSALEALQAQCQTALDADVRKLAELEERRVLVDASKHEVEDQIMKGLNAREGDAARGGAGGEAVAEPPRPEVEALTPPATEPDEMGEPVFPGEPEPVVAAAAAAGPSPQIDSVVPQQAQPPALPASISSASGIEILSHLASQAVPVSTNGTNKRRRVDSGDEVPNLDDGIDADVAEALRQEREGA